MSQAVGIANAVIPVEAGSKTASATEAVSKKNPKQEMDLANPLNKSDHEAGDSTQTTSTSEAPYSAAFSKILQKKLEKKEKIPQEEKLQLENKQELFIPAVTVPAESILPTGKLPATNSGQSVSQNNKTAKVNLTQKQAETVRTFSVPSVTTHIETTENNKVQRQILPAAKESAHPKETGKEPAAANFIKPSVAAEDQSQPAKKDMLPAVKDMPAGRSKASTDSKGPVIENRNQPQETGSKQIGQASSVRLLPSQNQVQTDSIAASQTGTVKPNQTDSAVRSAAAVKQEGPVGSSSDSEIDVKEIKTAAVSKKQAIPEQAVQKSVFQNTLDNASEGPRPVSSFETGVPPIRVLSQTAAVSPADSPVSRIASDPSAPLSAAQQILRGLQSSADSDVRTVQLALSPAGLGIVRIQLQREGSEISGVLEVQKAETRREIEKSLPQIISILDSQGLQVRRIDVNPLPNSNQKQQEFEASDQWALHREMSEQTYSRDKTSETFHQNPASVPVNEIISDDNKRGYILNDGSEALNLYA